MQFPFKEAFCQAGLMADQSEFYFNTGSKILVDNRRAECIKVNDVMFNPFGNPRVKIKSSLPRKHTQP